MDLAADWTVRIEMLKCYCGHRGETLRLLLLLQRPSTLKCCLLLSLRHSLVGRFPRALSGFEGETNLVDRCRLRYWILEQGVQVRQLSLTTMGLIDRPLQSLQKAIHLLRSITTGSERFADHLGSALSP